MDNDGYVKLVRQFIAVYLFMFVYYWCCFQLYQLKFFNRYPKCAGYVLGRFAVLEDLALLKITHLKALYDDVWPDYLRLQSHTIPYCLIG